MRLSRRNLLVAAAASAPLATLGSSVRAAAPSLPLGSPAAAGFDPVKLRALSTDLQDLVDRGQLAGVTTLAARKGKIFHFETRGLADVETGAPARPDTIWRIASMTKPVAGVAMMQLWEKGLWKLEDPVERHIPEFAGLKVKAADGSLVPQASPMNMAQLMSHTAGFDVSAGYAQAGLRAGDLKEMIRRLAALPLAAQPGSDWRYGPSVDIQGHVVERLSGERLDAYLDRHVFGPLKMVDTGLHVPAAKAARVARIHTYREGRIVAGPPQAIPVTPPVFLSGSGGLFSTAADYFRFSQALLNEGTLEGARILKPETVRLMRRSVLAPGVKVDLYGPAQSGTGFGLDFAVIEDPAAAGTPQGRDTYYWGGAFGTWFWIDPTNDIVFVGMIQNLNGSIPGAGSPPVRELSIRRLYAALRTPAA
ncbi:MAG: beta-lactamase family protein [Phenylobacterium sp.]|uniref:serine hydrolase domain-containing protein n=1 Tax=Phenylobacterium sp. TaxID=1871053 RepID=UPI0025F7B48C|nr:serine hydrolase domain-containing protein [Phenylobacterium sp.]MCA3738236.1 beta-lactamase family protein [Phenylobacterium sp.]MCA4917757.1 beta-lactamase family protein [Phenylobacterium sp.]MCA6278666.1 beta-lactamase family protein [Phenylobacterium sp.]MCA6282750.1 beta-lactamase family protein [Phenylobacterium sp.]MCA6295325.1 beta-lactamase family protein [Phenylobacterium sp.]